MSGSIISVREGDVEILASEIDMGDGGDEELRRDRSC